MGDIYVDVDALCELARRLQQIKSSLESAADTVNARDGRLGSNEIEGALDDFIKGWRDGRKKIVESIDGLVGRIQGAIEAYEEQERQIAKAARAGT